jgi:hypothetical protein
MSLSEAAERVEDAFSDIDSKINSLNAEIDSKFKL